MTDDDTQIKKFARFLSGLSLSADEKRTMREDLRAYTRENPIPEKNEAFLLQILRSSTMRRVAIAAVFVLLIAGSAVAAEHSLPGDFLYPLKTRINEPVRAALADSPEEQAEISSELMQRRLHEVEELAVTGELNAALEVQLHTQAQEHARDAATQIRALAKDNPDSSAEVVQEISTSLSVHEEVLRDLAGYGTSTKNKITAIRKEVAGAARDARRPRIATARSSEDEDREVGISQAQQASSSSLHAADTAQISARSLQPRARAKEKRARIHLDELAKTIERQSGRISMTAMGRATSTLDHLEEQTVAAQKALDAGKYAEALESFSSVIEAAINMRQRLNAAARLKREDLIPDIGGEREGSVRPHEGMPKPDASPTQSTSTDDRGDIETTRHEQQGSSTKKSSEDNISSTTSTDLEVDSSAETQNEADAEAGADAETNAEGEIRVGIEQ